jgi:hypothetical protein
VFPAAHSVRKRIAKQRQRKTTLNELTAAGQRALNELVAASK